MAIAAHEEYISHKLKMDTGNEASNASTYLILNNLKQEDDEKCDGEEDSEEEDAESLRLYDAFQTVRLTVWPPHQQTGILTNIEAHDNAKELAITWKGVSSSKQERDKIAENFLRMKDTVDKAGHDYKRAVWYGNKVRS